MKIYMRSSWLPVSRLRFEPIATVTLLPGSITSSIKTFCREEQSWEVKTYPALIFLFFLFLIIYRKWMQPATQKVNSTDKRIQKADAQKICQLMQWTICPNSVLLIRRDLHTGEAIDKLVGSMQALIIHNEKKMNTCMPFQYTLQLLMYLSTTRSCFYQRLRHNHNSYALLHDHY